MDELGFYVPSTVFQSFRDDYFVKTFYEENGVKI